MKVNEWINQQFWQSISIFLAASVEYGGQIQLHYKLYLPKATHTTKFCAEQIFDIDIAIALKVILKHNWPIWKISRIPSQTKPKLILPISKEGNWFFWEYKPHKPI